MLNYFLRSKPDLNFAITMDMRIACISLLLLTIVLFYKFKNNKKILRYTAIASLILQCSMISWFFFTSKNFLSEGLPLYHCRVSMLVISLAVIFKKEDSNIVRYVSLLSIFGASIALIFCDFDKYYPLHITTINFIFSHCFLLFNSLMIVKYHHQSLKIGKIISTTVLLNLSVLIVNILVNGNYSYLIELPSVINVEPFSLFPPGVVIFFCVLIVWIVNKIANVRESKAVNLLENESYN